MSSINLTCVICSENYKNSDTIISTGCGHVFHSNCLQEWRVRSSQCPTCRATIPKTYRLYLNFEENFAESSKQILELKSKIEQYIKQNSLLQQQLDASEKDFLQLQAQFSKKDDEIREFHKKIDLLTMQNATRANEIEAKTIEIHKLQEALNSANPQASSNILLQEEIKILKEKNKQITDKLNEEIQNSIQLSVSEMRLKNMLEQSRASTPVVVRERPTPMNRKNLASNQQKATETSTKEESKQPQRPDSAQSGCYPTNRGCMQSVVIKHVPSNFIDSDELKRYVLNMAFLMDLTFAEDDIEQVTVMERRPNGIMSLIAKFKNVGMKSQFMARKDKLKHFPDTKNLQIFEHVSDMTNSLFIHARSLKPAYKHVFVKNHNVYVRKDDSSLNIRIKDRADIDRLKMEVVNANVVEPLSPEDLPHVTSARSHTNAERQGSAGARLPFSAIQEFLQRMMLDDRDD